MSKLIQLFDVSPIATKLAEGHLFLTPNQRLASRIAAAYAIDNSHRGIHITQAPQVYSLSHWVDQLWEHLVFDASPTVAGLRLLSATQEQVLWENIVETSVLAAPLLRPAATATQAISAYRTMVEWQQDFSDEQITALFEADEDASILLAWVEAFEHQCQQHRWLPRVRQAEYVIRAFERGELNHEAKIFGIGFDNISPLHRKLIDVAGPSELLELGKSASSVEVVACDNVKQELLCAAVWAKKVLRDDPGATVALVIPELTQQRTIVQRVLQEVFEPEFNQPGQQRRNLPFNLSAGYPLVDAPVIRAALDGLSLSLPAMDLDTIAALLHSPFYNLNDNDADVISALLALVYNEHSNRITAARLRQLARQADEALLRSATDCPTGDDIEPRQPWHFVAALQTLANRVRTITNKQMPSAWLPVFQGLLSVIGWPGLRTLDSIEYQQVNQWQQALEEFASLDCVVAPIDVSQAIVYLRGILSRQIFQPQTADSSLQVLGTLEAAGLQFSHIWLHSMSAEKWPPRPAPNALLPFSLQRQKNMPNATAERELEYARRLSERFISSANEIVISYPAVVDDSPAQVSSLFSHYPRVSVTTLLGRELDALSPMIEIRRRHLESASTQPFEAGTAPPLTANENIRGGSQLFANQSACPFRAFVSNRLNITALPAMQLGLNAAQRGSLLHRCLEVVWEKLKSQENLLLKSDEQLQQLCRDAANYSLNELAQRQSISLGPRFTQLETQRLQKLLLAWLAVEKQREPFEVQNIETRQAFRFAQLELNMRIDRIDKLSDGSLLIIDYKSGNCTINRWWGERPDEPQLPLYSVLIDNRLNAGGAEAQTAEQGVGGIAFAQICVDGCGLKGVGAQSLAEPMVQWRDKLKTDAAVESWPQLKQQWQKILAALARDFINGKSDVDPKQLPQTCQYCDLGSVCRVNHQELV